MRASSREAAFANIRRSEAVKPKDSPHDKSILALIRTVDSFAFARTYHGIGALGAVEQASFGGLGATLTVVIETLRPESVQQHGQTCSQKVLLEGGQSQSYGCDPDYAVRCQAPQIHRRCRPLASP